MHGRGHLPAGKTFPSSQPVALVACRLCRTHALSLSASPRFGEWGGSAPSPTVSSRRPDRPLFSGRARASLPDACCGAATGGRGKGWLLGVPGGERKQPSPSARGRPDTHARVVLFSPAAGGSSERQPRPAPDRQLFPRRGPEVPLAERAGRSTSPRPGPGRELRPPQPVSVGETTPRDRTKTPRAAWVSCDGCLQGPELPRPESGGGKSKVAHRGVRSAPRPSSCADAASSLRVCPCPDLPFSKGRQSRGGLSPPGGLTHRDRFSEDPVSKYSHIHARISHANFGGDPVQPQPGMVTFLF